MARVIVSFWLVLCMTSSIWAMEPEQQQLRQRVDQLEEENYVLRREVERLRNQQYRGSGSLGSYEWRRSPLRGTNETINDALRLKNSLDRLTR
jgi:hypothetical protein